MGQGKQIYEGGSIWGVLFLPLGRLLVVLVITP